MASYFITEAVELPAFGTLLLEIDITMFEVPFHTKEEAEPVPVPKTKVFTVFAIGRKPLFTNVPK